MADPVTPYDACVLPSTAGALWVIGLSGLPAQPVDLVGVQAVQSPCPPAALAYTSEPVEIIAGALVQLEGTCQLVYPEGGMGDVRIAALAVVAGSPPSLLIDWIPLQAPGTLHGPNDVLLASLALTVAKQPG